MYLIVVLAKRFGQIICEEVMWFGFQGVILNAAYKTKDPQPDPLESLFNLFYIFSISIWGGDKD